MPHTLQVNRAPVLTLWAAVVAERLGHEPALALTLGRAVAGLNAQAKGRRLGIFEEPAAKRGAPPERKRAAGRPEVVTLLGRAIPVVSTPHGLRALDKERPMEADSVERYLSQKFGEALADVRGAFRELAKSYPPAALADSAYSLYEKFRPEVPAGARGWGASGVLDLDKVRSLATHKPAR